MIAHHLDVPTSPHHLLAQWAQAARCLSTVGQYQTFRTTARLLNEEKGALTRAAFGRLIEGLQDPETVARVAARLSPEICRHLEGDLDAVRSVSQVTIVGPVSEAAQKARTVGRYIWGRRAAIAAVVRDGSRTDAALEAYRFQPDRLKGRFLSHEAVERTPLSHEGFEAFEAEHAGDLAEARDFLETQRGFGGTSYEGGRDRLIDHAEAVQKAWDRMISLIHSHNPPSFEKVSSAFWDRDQAIRNNALLRSKGISPWEFDLIRTFRKDWKNNARGRFQRFAAAWAYILRKINDRYNSEHREEVRKRLAEERFELEKAYWTMAKNDADEKGMIDASLRVYQAEGKYMAFLDVDTDLPELSEIHELDRSAQDALAHYKNRRHEIHVATARQQYDFFKFRMQKDYEMEREEQAWQTARYTQLIEETASSGGEVQKLRTLLDVYKKSGEDYLEVAQAMLEEDEGVREHNRNGKYRDLFLALWELHDAVKAALKKAGRTDTDGFEILTFTYKAQAKKIAGGAKNVHGVEPLVEVTMGLKGELEKQEKGAYLTPALAKISGRDWGANLITHYVRQLHIVGIKTLFGYFGQGLRPESLMVEGGLDTFPEGAEDIPTAEYPRRAAITDATHTSQPEFWQGLGVTYMTGLPHTAILAQSGVGYFPVAGSFLSWLERGGYRHLGSGALINRGSNPRARAFADFTQKAHLAMGNFLNIYPGGTRKIASPVPSMYADLRRHPEALHMPDFYPTDYSTGQPIKVALESGAPSIPVAHNLGKIYPEPSMPMPPELEMPGRKDLLKPKRLVSKVGKIVKYPLNLKGFVSPRTMFPYMRPGTEDATVAYGEPIFVESFVGEEDLEAMGYDTRLAARQVKWLLLQLNYALVRTGEMRAGYAASAGIYG